MESGPGHTCVIVLGQGMDMLQVLHPPRNRGRVEEKKSGQGKKPTSGKPQPQIQHQGLPQTEGRLDVHKEMIPLAIGEMWKSRMMKERSI